MFNWILWSLVGEVLAGNLLAWERKDFPRSALIGDGTDGWQSGFALDPWYGSTNGRYASPATDFNTEDYPGGASAYGGGGASDNWLLRGEEVGQGSVTALVFSEDDDTLGLVFAHNQRSSFYLLGWSADSAPPPLEIIEGNTAGGELFLIRVAEGVPQLTERVPVDFSMAAWNSLTLSVDNGRVRGTINEILYIDWLDPNPLPAGQAGLYAYDAGWEGSYGATNVFFDLVTVYWTDEDDDGVGDDSDNCEFIVNPDQTDGDGDGVGDACEAPSPAEDTYPDIDLESDTDDINTDTDRAPAAAPLDGEDLVAAGCGCSTPGARLPSLALSVSAFFMAVWWYNRRSTHNLARAPRSYVETFAPQKS